MSLVHNVIMSTVVKISMLQNQSPAILRTRSTSAFLHPVVPSSMYAWHRGIVYIVIEVYLYITHLPLRLSRRSLTYSTMSAPGARWALEGEKKSRNLDLADVQDDSEQVLVSLVLLFCPDMLDLVERAKVEAAQLKFATLLQRYLKHKWV